MGGLYWGDGIGGDCIGEKGSIGAVILGRMGYLGEGVLEGTVI